MSDEAGPAVLVETAAQSRLLLTALRALAEANRLTLLLFHLHDYSIGEIAQLAGTPLTAVKKRLSDGRGKLKSRLMKTNSVTNVNEARRMVEVSQLVQAVARLDTETIRTLLRGRKALARTVLYYNDPHGQSLLQRAIPGDGEKESEAQLEILRLLLEHGADPNAADWDGRPSPPLMKAAWGGQTATIELLLQFGADANVGSPDGVWWWRDNYRPVDNAAIHGHAQAVRILIARGARYSLADAVMAGLADECTVLLNGDPKLINEIQAGQTPLHHAVAWHFHPEILELLLARGADAEARNDHGYTVFQWALNRGKDQTVLQPLVRHGACLDVCAAAGLGDTYLLGEILRGDPRAARSELLDGTTPLFFAVNAQNVEAAKMLLGAGANANATGTDEWRGRQGQGTPLRLAARVGEAEIVRLLLSHGAQVDGQVVLNAVQSNIEVLTAVLSHDAGTVNFIDPAFGFSAMDWAVLHNKAGAAEFLLKHGFNANLPGSSGAQYSHFPLHFAAQHGRVEIALLLLAHGADKAARNQLLQTPSEVALANSHEEMGEMLAPQE